MKKNLLLCVLGLILILTGCNLKGKEQEKEVVVKGLNTIIEYNSSEDTDVTKIKYKVINNSNDKFEMKNITFEITLNDETVQKVNKEVNHTVKVGETYEIEADANINPKTVKNVNYFTD